MGPGSAASDDVTATEIVSQGPV